MPFYKRRKLSLDEQDGKEVDRNRYFFNRFPSATVVELTAMLFWVSPGLLDGLSGLTLLVVILPNAIDSSPSPSGYSCEDSCGSVQFHLDFQWLCFEDACGSHFEFLSIANEIQNWKKNIGGKWVNRLSIVIIHCWLLDDRYNFCLLICCTFFYSDGKQGKQGSSGSGKPPSLPERRCSRHEKRADMSSPATTLVADDDNGTDGTTPGTSDTYGRVSSSGRVIKQTNKGKIFSAALLVAQAKQTNSQSKILGYGL